MKNFRPMKGYALSNSELAKLRYPLIAQPKLDGICCVILDSKPKTYSLKDIPNLHIRNKLSVDTGIKIIHGELICPNKTFNETQSAIMSEAGEPTFNFVVFDLLNSNIPYSNRMAFVKPKADFPDYFKLIQSVVVSNSTELLSYEEYCLAQGHEGVILRDPIALYKFGRSTLKEQGMLKLKRFVDAEAKIIGFQELMINGNDQTLNNHGLAERSSHQNNLISANTLGALLVRGINGKFKDVEFKIGSGFDDSTRDIIWRTKPLDKIITYKFQDHNCKDKPRLPIFKGFRKDV